MEGEGVEEGQVADLAGQLKEVLTLVDEVVAVAGGDAFWVVGEKAGYALVGVASDEGATGFGGRCRSTGERPTERVHSYLKSV